MLPYQTSYLDNLREILSLSDFYRSSRTSFEEYYAERLSARQRTAELKAENLRLLSDHLFPALDNLHAAEEEDISHLEEFAEALLDWKTNLDCGVYLLIHESLLSLFRVRRDRDGIIRELYKVGMGLYYQNRSVQGMDKKRSASFYFQNEMVFTEAASYLSFFEEIESEETKGYIIRSLANISIATSDVRKKIAASSRVLKVVQDDYYRNLAPGLPWSVFLEKTYQQMSSNRHVLSKGDLSSQELMEVLEACQIVFRPEAHNQTPNVRWLWPYYEMEYSCGFADLSTTLARMERLIESVSYDQYDISGLYANVQLPIYYGRLMQENPSIREKKSCAEFLSRSFRKMMKTLLSFPMEQFGDFFLYDLILVISDYYEMDGVPTYREITTLLMQKFAGDLYIRSRRVGDLLRILSLYLYSREPAFFDDIPFLKAITDDAEKKKALEEYALLCGLYHDFGLMKLNLERLQNSRFLFEREDAIHQLHTASGYDDLIARQSTRDFADIALGHHGWYNGSGGYPAEYIRLKSSCRAMTDLVSVAVYLDDNGKEDLEKAIQEVQALQGKRFSPLITADLNDEELRKSLEEVLQNGDRPYFEEFFQELNGQASRS